MIRQVRERTHPDRRTWFLARETGWSSNSTALCLSDAVGGGRGEQERRKGGGAPPGSSHLHTQGLRADVPWAVHLDLRRKETTQ